MPIQTKTDPCMPTVTLYRLVSARDGQVVRFTALAEQAEESLLPIMNSAQARVEGYHGFLELLLQARYPHDGLTRFHLVPEAVPDADLTYHRERVIHCEEKGDIDDMSEWAEYEIDMSTIAERANEGLKTIFNLVSKDFPPHIVEVTQDLSALETLYGHNKN